MSLQNGQRSPAVILNGALRAGIVIKPDVCDGCKRKGLNLYSYQHNPSEPLDVAWLCRPCTEPKSNSIKPVAREVTVPLGLRIPISLYVAVQSLAQEDARSVANMVRRLVEEHPRIRKELKAKTA